MINKRKARGMTLLEQGFEPKEINSYTWVVPSQSGCSTYTVVFNYRRNRWKCTCPDYELRGLPCKHISAVKIWKNLKTKFEQLNLHLNRVLGLNNAFLKYHVNSATV